MVIMEEKNINKCIFIVFQILSSVSSIPHRMQLSFTLIRVAFLHVHSVKCFVTSCLGDNVYVHVNERFRQVQVSNS